MFYICSAKLDLAQVLGVPEDLKLRRGRGEGEIKKRGVEKKRREKKRVEGERKRKNMRRGEKEKRIGGDEK